MSQEFFRSTEKSPEEALEVLKEKLEKHKNHLIERIYEKWRDEVQFHSLRLYWEKGRIDYDKNGNPIKDSTYYKCNIENFDQFKDEFSNMKEGDGVDCFGRYRNYQIKVALLPEEALFPFNLVFKDIQTVDFGPLINKYDKFCELTDILLDTNTGLEEKEVLCLQFIQDPENRKIFFESSNGKPDSIFGDLFREIKKFFRYIFGIKTTNEVFIEETENLLLTHFK